MTSEIAQRAGDFLDRAFIGGSRNKRIAQQLGISPEMAKLLRRGHGWTAARLTQVWKMYGRDFVGFVFQGTLPDPAALRAEMDEFDHRLARLEAERLAEDARGALALAGMVAKTAGAEARPNLPVEEAADQVAGPGRGRR